MTLAGHAASKGIPICFWASRMDSASGPAKTQTRRAAGIKRLRSPRRPERGGPLQWETVRPIIQNASLLTTNGICFGSPP